MQRRDFSRSLLAAAGTAAAGLTLTPAHAQRVNPQEGVDFVKLARPVPVQSAMGQVEVLEFFAYSCIFCAEFEPAFAQWIEQKPSHVVVRRMPVAFSPQFVPMQRLYFSLEAMGLVDKLHAKVFHAFHAERQPLVTPSAIVDWVAQQGVDRERFVETFNARPTGEKAAQAVALQDAYEIEGTPSLGVGGRYTLKGQGPRTLVVANALIAGLPSKG
ncbi:thiol:disulfide interchange protein DsbA/DsbL [Hydrogenophaga sp. BPS33]|uniref:thiol:disulfide interchange protein DsbA/DsbL n=1 Tax=Hydrogenophaga sp. BPS33 TaxID=2651974 RepID=UPI00131FDCED|nr:thiol:disulfide interchange protein DsbA/DsbL [Hydrogenophaga sp. BPS33]QHE88289.1 thiol:disulfide interchange protein DsbA/DsbL [Hydrogenophaga sp. BPS33]